MNRVLRNLALKPIRISHTGSLTTKFLSLSLHTSFNRQFTDIPTMSKPYRKDRSNGPRDNTRNKFNKRTGRREERSDVNRGLSKDGDIITPPESIDILKEQSLKSYLGQSNLNISQSALDSLNLTLKNNSTFEKLPHYNDFSLPIPELDLETLNRHGKKYKFAMHISYTGTGYHGLQINGDFKTLELDIIQAMYKAGFIDAIQASQPNKMKLQRAARTDKGVHAACNTISAKLRILPELLSPEIAALRKEYYGKSKLLTKSLHNYLDALFESKLNLTIPIDFLSHEAYVFSWGEVHLSDNLKAFLTHHDIDISNLTSKMTYTVDNRTHRILKFCTRPSKLSAFSPDYVAWSNMTLEARKNALEEYVNKATEILGSYSERDGNANKVKNSNYNDPDSHIKVIDPKTGKTIQYTAKPATPTKPVSTGDGEIVDRDNRRDNTWTNGAKNNNERDNDDESSTDIDDFELNLFTNPDFLSESICSALNMHLPNQIRVTSAVKVVNSFDAHLEATSRTYEYIVPSYAFMPISEYPEGLFDSMMTACPTNSESFVDAENNMKRKVNDEEIDDFENTSNISEMPDLLKNYRITEEHKEKVNRILSHFHGTHHYHNFTRGLPPNNPSGFRFMRKMQINGCFYLDGVEFVHLVVHGQSFLLNQIRKMVAYAICTARGSFHEDLIHKFFSNDRYRVPIAPALGLLLDHVNFHTYDLKCISNTDIIKKSPPFFNICKNRDPISYHYDKIAHRVTNFKQSNIYPEICSKELSTESCWRWLHWVNDNTFWGVEQDDNKGHIKHPKFRGEVDASSQKNVQLNYVCEEDMIPTTNTNINK